MAATKGPRLKAEDDGYSEVSAVALGVITETKKHVTTGLDPVVHGDTHRQ